MGKALTRHGYASDLALRARRKGFERDANSEETDKITLGALTPTP